MPLLDQHLLLGLRRCVIPNAMIRRILVGLDSSERAAQVFATAAEIATVFGAELILLRIVAVPPEFPAAGAGTEPDALPAILVREASDELRALAATRPATRCTARVEVSENAPRILVSQADALDVDLVVIGSHGYRGLDRILGTTAAYVVNHAHRNVFVVHDDARRRVP